LSDPAELQLLATAAFLNGREQDATDFGTRAHQGFVNAGEMCPAARCAFWLALGAAINGDIAQAGGWVARGNRLLENQGDCVEKGYLLVPAGIGAVRAGDIAAAFDAFVEATAIGNRFGDKDLATLAMNGQGRVLVRQGEVARGLVLLDEAMVAVMAGEVSAPIAGAVYCSVIESCHDTFDLRRAQEWTEALSQWCASQPDQLPYRGPCLLHRAEILQLRGKWSDALEEAHRAHERLSQPTPRPAVGSAFYRMAELHRLCGEFAAAEEAYRQASQWHRTPQPRLALLRLAQGQIDAAYAAIRRVADEVVEPGNRSRILAAYVEIALARNDVPGARTAADELSQIAQRIGAPFLRAVSAGATGAVLLAEQDARKALPLLRQAWTAWRKLEAPYEAARVQVLIAIGCKAQGDSDSADLELAAARELFLQLGAEPDANRVDALSHAGKLSATGPLSVREVGVLKLVASGATNRDIADKLGISEKTVARHVSNIFLKLDLSSRAAATAYAFQNKLV
jgi:DNA-binding NarL/FixJ family response regulator